MDFKDWKVWALIIASVLAFGLALMYPYSPQKQEVLQQYEQLPDDEIIDIIVTIPDLESAKAFLSVKYGGYVIIEQYYLDSKKAWLFKLKKAGDK